jgi:hypothetical protein
MRRAVYIEADMGLDIGTGWMWRGRYIYPRAPFRIERRGDGYKHLVWVDHQGRTWAQRFRGTLYMTSETDAS